jgi:hypothetical protein
MNSIGNFLKSYQATLIGSAFVFVIIGYPFIAIKFNPAPTLSSMKEMQGSIEFVQRDFPHLRLKLDNGQTTDFMFPGDLHGVYLANWGRFFSGKTEQFKSMKGCVAKVKYDELRHVFVSTPLRMWSVECDRYSISYDEIKRRFDEKNEFHGLFTSAKGWLLVFAFSLVAFAFCVENYAERKKSK